MRSIVAKYGQSLFDIALEYYGNIQGVFWLVEDNELNGITDNVFDGDLLLIRDEVLNNNTVELLKTYTVATVFDPEERAEGIDYMIVEQTLIVE
jgi:hypothetical protein